MGKIFLITMLLLTSCASQAERKWGPWKREGVAEYEMTWHFCHKELDGPSNHEKGMCYQANECRTRKTIFGRTKRECRNKLLICKWGDIECMRYHNLMNRIIINREQRN